MASWSDPSLSIIIILGLQHCPVHQNYLSLYQNGMNSVHVFSVIQCLPWLYYNDESESHARDVIWMGTYPTVSFKLYWLPMLFNIIYSYIAGHRTIVRTSSHPREHDIVRISTCYNWACTCGHSSSSWWWWWHKVNSVVWLKSLISK